MEGFECRLTPTKIMRLLQLAESATPQQAAAAPRAARRVLAEKNIETVINNETYLHETHSIGSPQHNSKHNTPCESTGILDLDQCEGIGESCDLGSNLTMAMSVRTSFYPGEMTGRSTGATDCDPAVANLKESAAIEELAARMQQQSCDVADIVRNSVCNNYSFATTQPDLSRDEMSFVRERGELPMSQSQLNLNLTKTSRAITADTTADMSVGSYFMKGSQTLADMIGRSDSPQYDVSIAPSIAEADSRMYGVQPGFATINDSDCVVLDSTLDHVPTRQPRPSVSNQSTTTSAVAATISTVPATVQANAAPSMMCAPQLQHLVPPNSARNYEDSSLGPDASLSISLISKCLGKCEDDVTPSMLIAEAKNKKKSKKVQKDIVTPPIQKDTFTLPGKSCSSRPIPMETDNPQFVATLKHSGKAKTASSSGSVNTVISVPVKRDSSNKENVCKEVANCKEVKRESKKSSDASYKTAYTVQENRISTSNGQGLEEKKEAWCEFSPTYRPLDQSINWQEILLKSSRVSPGNNKWVEIEHDAVEGYVGVCTVAKVKLTSVSESFLAARLHLDDSTPDDNSIAVDIPRLPLLLKPGAAMSFSLTLTAFKPIKEIITVVLQLQDTCEEVETHQLIKLNVNFILPSIEIVKYDDDEVLKFPPTNLGSETLKSFVIVSDCTKSLQLTLSVAPNSNAFSIGCIEEIKREDIRRVLAADQRLVSEEGKVAGSKYKAMKHSLKQVCVLSEGSALKVTMVCKAPSSIATGTPRSTLNGTLSIHLVETNTLLQKVSLAAAIGTIKLLLQMSEDKLHLTREHQTVDVKNVGSISGTWRTSVRGGNAGHFAVTPLLLEVPPGTVASIQIAHTKQPIAIECSLILESVHEGKELIVEMTATADKKTNFPIKTTQTEMAWVKEGKKDISLKNISEKPVAVKCKIYGEGYYIESRRESGTEMTINFTPNECIGLNVYYNPREKGTHKAKLAISLDRDASSLKCVYLHGSSGGGGGVRWGAGVVTCGEIAIVFARRRAPVTLTLENRSREPAFYSARMLFNLQYRSLGSACCVTPARGVLAPLASITLSMELDWARLDRVRDAVPTLASLFILVGSEMTRRRILRILKNDSDIEVTASPTEDLTRLSGQFVGEDPFLDAKIKDFAETKKSLPTLTASIQELTAQIELSREWGAVDRTVVLSDDTCIEHHTLLE